MRIFVYSHSMNFSAGWTLNAEIKESRIQKTQKYIETVISNENNKKKKHGALI